MLTVVVNNSVLLRKIRLRNIAHHHKKDIAQRVSNGEISWETFPTINWSMKSKIMHLLLLTVLHFTFQPEPVFSRTEICCQIRHGLRKDVVDISHPNQILFFICQNDNFMALNKFTLKYQEAYDIVNNFITADNKHFLLLLEYLKKECAIPLPYVIPKIFL